MSGSKRRFDGKPTDEEELERRGKKLGNTSGPVPLGESLERFVQNLGAPPISVLHSLEQRWPDVVGPGLSATTRPLELVDGVLTIGCEDAAWAAQVGWMEAQITQRFEEVFGPGLVRRVSVRTDR
ncbi:MAG: DUF721 domain-containing protein [Actinomycetota bacterium]